MSDRQEHVAGEQVFAYADVENVETKVLQKGFFQLEQRRLRHRRFNGGWSDVINREVHVRHDAVGVLPYDPVLDRVVFVEQIRAGMLDDERTPWSLEPVAGLVDKDESAAEVARREADEEAGCELSELIELYRYYPSPGACTEQVTLFIGLCDSSGLGGVHGLAEENEDIRVHVLDFQAALDLLEQGRLGNAMAIMAMQWLLRERASLRVMHA
ncbi:NUDIX domain-containing protein [Cobetia sp. L2A1]|uniref:NUDIX domain-containing protein n=1 Tax=Cobetia sp. L2A1 TaxID=2686360 RepID=UPI00131BB789|nr:NUDIX domain-containing protein [Cobetia sp. L2A1]